MRKLILAATALAALPMSIVKKFAVALLAATARATVSAQAATITLLPNTCNHKEEGCTAVWIEGRIEANDGGKFMEILLKDKPKKALILLHSEGGNVMAALQMGRYIKANNYATYVPSKAVCVSSCAFVWLAGNLKQVGENGKIGFHAAYYTEKVGKQTYALESGVGNAVIGAYYAELGYSQDAIMFFTKSSPGSMSWLNSDTAERLGIRVKVITDKKEEKS